MYYQYNASELADSDRWNDNCQKTEQQRLNKQADWPTILQHYQGNNWQLTRPISRGGVMTGPSFYPTNVLPAPVINLTNAGQAQSRSVKLHVLVRGQPVDAATVFQYLLVTSYRVAIPQGLTVNGEITLMGVIPGDEIRVATLNGAFSGEITIDAGKEDDYTLELANSRRESYALAETGKNPYLYIVPANGEDLYLQVEGVRPSRQKLSISVFFPEDRRSLSTNAEYDATQDAYLTAVIPGGLRLGLSRAQVDGAGNIPNLVSDFQAQHVTSQEPTTLYSADGMVELLLSAKSTPADSYAITTSSSSLPSDPPVGFTLIGQPYNTRLSGGFVKLEGQDNIIQMYYNPVIGQRYRRLVIHRWTGETWQALETQTTNQAASATIDYVGVYALMGADAYPTVYLPLIVK